MTKVIAKTYTIAYEYKLQIAYALIATCGFLIVLYGANVYGIIKNTVAIKEAEQQVIALSTAVQNLDKQYLELSSRTTPDALKQYGLKEGKVTSYINKQATVGMR